MNEQATARALYKKLLRLYPREFRERLGESMEQTFNDLCNEQKRGPGRGFFVLSIFTETAIGIVQEHLFLLIEGDVMKNMLANPRSAAITSLLLALPLGLTFVAFMFNIEPLVKPLNNLFTIEGQQGEMNTLGRIVIYGGLLFLPVAFVLNLRPLLKKEGPEGKRRLYALNLIVGAAILLLITFTWGGLILEEIYCLRGIRCD
ncbi:MAG TPA: hypothetical protein VGA72_08585 [Anaerolineales bacterium]